jgi:hypothetical protein
MFSRLSFCGLLALSVAACGEGAPAGAMDGPSGGNRRRDGAVTDGSRAADGPRLDAPRSPDGGSVDAAPPDAGARDAGPSGDGPGSTRRLTFTAAILPNGVSEPVSFDVPAGTRSMTIVVKGAGDKLYALAGLRTGDGMERVGIDPAGQYGAMMEDSYQRLQTGEMPGNLYQSIRLGTFTQIYPYAPGHVLSAGTTQLRVASNATGGDVTVDVFLPPDDGASVLHLNVLAVSTTLTLTDPPGFITELQRIFDQVGIRVVADSVGSLRGSGFNDITDFTEPQESPTSMSAQLAMLAQASFTTDALPILIVDGLPAGVGGLSLGTPGPPLRASYYFGILVARQSDLQMARVIAHEAAHFLALQHVENRDTTGRVITDPIDDTMPGQGNLMENGTILTPGQAFALTRSALLRTQ